MATMTAQAQFDYFAQPRTIQMLPSKFLSVGFTNIGTGTLSGAWTNSIDVHGSDGIAKLDLVVVSNTAGASVQAYLTNSLVTSVDNTNWVPLTTVAIATSTAVSYTNLMYGTNLIVTDTYLLPGTVSTITTGTSGYAPPNAVLGLLVPAPYTNSITGANQSATAIYSYGFNIADAYRYIGLVSSLTGSNATYNVQGFLTVRKQY
jgi:hypothetical protein